MVRTDIKDENMRAFDFIPPKVVLGIAKGLITEIINNYYNFCELY